METTRWLKQLASELGFDDCGIARADQGTPTSEHFLGAMGAGFLDPLDYMQRTADVRADVQTLLPGAKSVVVFVKNYYAGDHHQHVAASELVGAAKVSRYAWGGDYHHWFKKRLRKARRAIQERFGEHIRVHIFNDTGPVLERAWAERAGLGFIGKSGMFIHRKFGTWTFLGGFVSDLELAPDKPSAQQYCGSCTACMDACPTNAIVEPRRIDARRCLTTWTVERPLHQRADDPELRGHGWALGCDVCQEVCPWNKFQALTLETRFLPFPSRVALKSGDIKGDLAGTPMARPKKEGMARNVRRALALTELGQVADQASETP